MNIKNRMHLYIKLVAVALFSILFPSIALAQEDKVESGKRWTAPDTSGLSNDIPQLLKMAGVPGISLAVIQGDRIYWTGNFGTINDSIQSPVNQNTVFEAASMSKPLFAYLVLRLVDRGEFDLDRPLAEFLEHPYISDERYKRITGRMVLTHSTGLPNWGDAPLELQFDPGTAFGYSGEAFVYLQKVIEKTTNKSLQNLAESEVFNPLGMKHSSFVWQERFDGNAAYGKNWLWKIKPISHYKESNAAASLITTASDYAKFIAAILNGTGLSPALWKSFLTPSNENSNGVFYGLGIGIEDGFSGQFFFHGGNNSRRFTCYMVGDLQTKVGLVFLTNSSDGITLGAELITRTLNKEFIPIIKDGIPHHDDRDRIISVAIQRAAVEQGENFARDLFYNTRTSKENHINPNEALYLIEILKGMNFDDLAFEILQTVVEDDASSLQAFTSIGEIYHSRREYQKAIEVYEKAMDLDPNDEGLAYRIQWIRESRESRRLPMELSKQTMECILGQYENRSVTMREGRLYYQRTGSEQKLLIPLTKDLFALEGSENFRIHFVIEGDSPAKKIIGLYIDGRKDEYRRTE